MSKYAYRFDVSNSDLKVSLSGAIWAWKWGDWKQSTSWTSEKTIDADFSTLNAREGLKRGGKMLMIAIPHHTSSPFKPKLEFEKVRVHTYKDLETLARTNTPMRTATYFNAEVLTVDAKDFSRIPNVGKSANYTEVLLRIVDDVEVAS